MKRLDSTPTGATVDAAISDLADYHDSLGDQMACWESERDDNPLEDHGTACDGFDVDGPF
jgi:hypothetical protein